MNSIGISSAPQLLAAAPLVLPMPEARVRAGFPSPAEDFTVNRLDLTQILVTHPQATFLLRVAGVSMREAGIDDGDNWWWTVPSSRDMAMWWSPWSMASSP